MHYLIDGHNLIAKMPDISLNDPDDEVQLVLRLRSWTAVSKKRQVTLFFDGGIPGGKNVRLSTPQVRVIFATVGKTADALIIKAINQVKNPAEFLLVTSDQQIIAAATARKLPHLTSNKFMLQLAQQWQEPLPGPTVTDDNPVLSDAEVDEWLATFGPVDEKAIRRRTRPQPPNLPPPPAPEPPPVVEKGKGLGSTAVPNREDPQISENELDEWLSLFGKDTKPASKTAPSQTPVPTPGKPRKKAANPHKLSQDDLNAWQNFANDEE